MWREGRADQSQARDDTCPLDDLQLARSRNLRAESRRLPCETDRSAGTLRPIPRRPRPDASRARERSPTSRPAFCGAPARARMRHVEISRRRSPPGALSCFAGLDDRRRRHSLGHARPRERAQRVDMAPLGCSGHAGPPPAHPGRFRDRSSQPRAPRPGAPIASDRAGRSPDRGHAYRRAGYSGDAHPHRRNRSPCPSPRAHGAAISGQRSTRRSISTGTLTRGDPPVTAEATCPERGVALLGSRLTSK